MRVLQSKAHCISHLFGKVLSVHSSGEVCSSPTHHLMGMHQHCRLVLQGPLFQRYFEKVEVSNFEVASDAFSTFKVLSVNVSLQPPTA